VISAPRNRTRVIVALSGGVDSAVAALLLRDAGYRVECLHMTNWRDDEHCTAAADYQDARRVAQQLDLPLHRVDFCDEYAENVFAAFLDDYRAGLTPNPDVLCNREIKFGAMSAYAKRLGGDRLATGHYARVVANGSEHELHKGADASKDQSYFLHAVPSVALSNVLFPLGELTKHDVRRRARAANLPTAEKKDSTGICFIGERRFRPFLASYLATTPGPIEDPDGRVVGEHQGIAFYTIGQRHGLDIGGRRGYSQAPWYVADKKTESNTLVAVQGADHPLLFKNRLAADDAHWIGTPPAGWQAGAPVACLAKTRYRQVDEACTLTRTGERTLAVTFDRPQRAVTPGQYVVFYAGERCLGGARIAATAMQPRTLEAAS
jgi:tRNA-specific 2-thiouridylase